MAAVKQVLWLRWRSHARQSTPMTPKWYAVYTKPRWEKKVAGLLLHRGIESYCPLNKVRRRWSDRMKTIEEPLFKSYVFVRIDDEARTAVRMTDGIINFVYWNGKPAVVKDAEINTIKRFLDEYENVTLQRIDVGVNERVKVIAGPMMEAEGRVLELKNKTAKVAIDSLGYVLVATIDKTKLIAAAQTTIA
jgi:transcription antitermination factor NusG